MLNIIALVVGIIIVICTLASVVLSVRKLPSDLRVSYGRLYAIISAFVLIEGVELILLSLVS